MRVNRESELMAEERETEELAVRTGQVQPSFGNSTGPAWLTRWPGGDRPASSFLREDGSLQIKHE